MTPAIAPAAEVAGFGPRHSNPSMALTAIDDVYAVLKKLVIPITGFEQLRLAEACGRISSRPAQTPHPLPRFDHSAVDGFGVGKDVLGHPNPRVKVMGALAAGNETAHAIGAGQAIRIFTGAKIPTGVRAVVMEEKAAFDGAEVKLPPNVIDGDNIRRAGEDIALGGTIVDAGHVLDSRHIAVMAAAGFPVVHVMRRLVLAIVSTGDEVVAAGQTASSSQIYDVNGPMLSALAAASPWIELKTVVHVKDDGSQLTHTFQSLATSHDVVICTGGASGSQTDHTAEAIISAGGVSHSLKVALKPGKPIVLGRLQDCLLLGFPGNPIAALVNFLLFGRPAMLATAGAKMTRPKGIPVVVDGILPAANERTEFVPAGIVRYADDGRPIVGRLGKAGSGRLMPLVLAEGLLEIPSRSANQSLASFHPFSSSISV